MLIFYDYEFNPLLTERHVLKSAWEIKYNGIGSFEAQLPAKSDAAALLAEHRYLVVRDEISCAVVVGYQMSDTLTIYGRTCNWILSKRIVEPTEYSGDAAKLARGIIESEFADTGIVAEADISGETVSLAEETRAPASDVISKLLGRAGLGHSLEYDTENKVWRFHVLCGKERPLMISEANRNAWDMSLTEDILDYYTCAVYDGGTVEKDEKTGLYRWQTDLLAKSEEEAAAKLCELRRNSELTLKLRGLEYGKDFELGDIVRVQIAAEGLRKTEKKRIAGLYAQTGDGCVYEPIFENVTEAE